MQLLAAMAVHASGRDPAADLAAMRPGHGRDALRPRQSPRPGRGLGRIVGVIAGEIVLAGHEEDEVALAVADLLLGTDTEMLTLVTGRDAAPGLAGLVASHVEGSAPGVEVVCYDGGMSSSVLLIGAE